MPTASDEKALVEKTLAQLRDGLEVFLQELKRVENEVRMRQETIRHWETRLAALRREDGDAPPRRRMEKGEPLRKITEVLTKCGTTGAAFKTLVSETAMGSSTVNAVLKRYPDKFAERDGRWRLANSVTFNADGAQADGPLARLKLTKQA